MYLTNKHLQQLLKNKNQGTHLSIFLPTHPASNSQTLTQDTTRLKNALKEIKNDPAYDAHKLGKSIKSLYTLVDDVGFWKQQSAGLAIFADSDGIAHYHLPYSTLEATYIDIRYVISPLIMMQSIRTEYCVLDVNITKPRLMKTDQGTLVEIGEDIMPGSFQETTARDEYKKQLQHMAAPRGSGGDNNFHSQGIEKALESDISKYLLQIADATALILKDNDLPLLLVGDQNRVGNLRPHLKYANVIAQSIDGSFEKHTPQELFDATIDAVQLYALSERRALVDQLLSSDPDLVATGAKEITEAASAGRVERMYVPAFKQAVDSDKSEQSNSIVLQLPDKIGELESLVRDVLAQGGSVVAVESDLYPDLSEIKGLCRY